MSRMMTPSRARAISSSYVRALNFGLAIGQGDHSSIPTCGDGIGTGGSVNNRPDGLTYSSTMLDMSTISC